MKKINNCICEYNKKLDAIEFEFNKHCTTNNLNELHKTINSLKILHGCFVMKKHSLLQEVDEDCNDDMHALNNLCLFHDVLCENIK